MATPSGTVDDIEWLWELALPDEAKRHLINRMSEMIISAITEERDRCVAVARAVADEDMPEPYWDNYRARRMDWGCACARIAGRIRDPGVRRSEFPRRI